MVQGGGSAYGVKYQARCISAVVADSEQTHFLVGTLSLKEENEVHLIKYSENSGNVTCDGLYPHHHEIWDLASCPFDSLIFSTVYAAVGEYGATLWKMPEDSNNSSQLEKLGDLDGHTKKIKCTLWWQGRARHNQLLSVDEETVYLWDMDTSGRSLQVTGKMSSGLLHQIMSGAWDPHDVGSIATVSESCVQFWDLRSMKKTQTVEHAHAHDIDYNPQKQHLFVTVGDESRIHVWDKRMPTTFLLELPGHSHWTCRARYNPIHDQLLLSSGTDSLVSLWMMTDIDNTATGSPDDSPRAYTDPLLRSYTGHEDSVYGIAWSLREPWIFASLSYDGRVLVDSVPQNIVKLISTLKKV